MLTPVLRAAGYEVTATSGGQEALAVVKAGKTFDIVVTDLEMPDMDGFALADAIRGHKSDGAYADHRALVDDLAGCDRAGPQGRLPRFRRQIRPSGSRRRSQGAWRRHSQGSLNDHEDDSKTPISDEIEYVTVMIGEQLFGLPIERVHDVFMPGHLTPVPLASEEIAGVLNLRGRIVTAIDMRCRLGLPKREDKTRVRWPSASIATANPTAS